MKSTLIGTGILVGGALVAFLLIALAPEPPKEAPPPQTPLVSTAPVAVEQGSLMVRGTGTVQAARSISLTAEVAGRLVSVSEALNSGGRFQEGDVLARIDPSDYEAAVAQARASVTEAEFQVLQAREEVQVAREEYTRLQQRTGQAPALDSTALGRLVYREPQLRRAEATLRSARAALQTAEANLERTAIRAPFNGRVDAKQADLGAYVAPGTPIATIYGTDVAEVVVPLPSRKAALIQGLYQSRAERSRTISATVSTQYGGETFAWPGYVDRVAGSIDAQTRTVNVVVRVDRPYETSAMQVTAQMPEQPRRVERPPLQVGRFTTVDIEGQAGARYAVVPRRAVRVREPNAPPSVWTVVDDSLLVEQTVRVIQTVGDAAYLAPTPALASGTPIVTSDLRVQTDSMRIRTTSP